MIKQSKVPGGPPKKKYIFENMEYMEKVGNIYEEVINYFIALLH